MSDRVRDAAYAAVTAYGTRVPYTLWRSTAWSTVLGNTHPLVDPRDWTISVEAYEVLHALFDAWPLPARRAFAWGTVRLEDFLATAMAMLALADDERAAVLTACSLGGLDAALALVRRRGP